MAGPYFQKTSWAPFCYQGQTYSLDHLDEFEIVVADCGGNDRRIAVTFGDHCFTREPQSVDPALVYPDSNRNPGHFCFERYALSLALRDHIATAVAGMYGSSETKPARPFQRMIRMAIGFSMSSYSVWIASRVFHCSCIYASDLPIPPTPPFLIRLEQ